ncbi:Glutathione peroxidase [Dillenia turbinata]|uniref:Glutathione peroxidase n=1 Tax=Dillenia turbinata TaxID=194707 RepID=A0AAN8UD26_9MAGN
MAYPYCPCSQLTQTNYKELSALYEKYKDKGLKIFAFPCNQFGKQEPGSNEEIVETVCTKFKAEFPVFDKNADPLYQFLKAEKGGFWEMVSNGTSPKGHRKAFGIFLRYEMNPAISYGFGNGR